MGLKNILLQNLMTNYVLMCSDQIDYMLDLDQLNLDCLPAERGVDNQQQWRLL